VHTYGASEEAGQLFLAMEYLDGQPWSRIRRALQQTGTLPTALHVKVLSEVLAGLHYAHELRDYDGTSVGVVHCDVSPQNVFVTYDGQVKIVDFGVACAVDDERRSGSKVLLGKLGYIAPEQARGDALDRRSDVFAVGVMLWEVLAGRRFAEGDDLRAIRARRVAGAEPRIREVVPEAPQQLAEICDRAISLDPLERFASAGEFREALRAYLGEDMQDVDRKQLGELVANAFDKDRSRVHALIERQLNRAPARPSSNDAPAIDLQADPAEYTLKADLSELISVSRLRDDAELRSASGGASVRVEHHVPRGPAWAGVGGALILLALWLWSRPGDNETALQAVQLKAASAPQASPRVERPSPPPTFTAPAPVRPSTMLLTVSASPQDATFVLDGIPLAGNPHSERRAADGELHVLRAIGPGLQSQERVIAFDRDRTISFELTTRAAARALTRPNTRRSSSSSPPATFASSTVASDAGPASPSRARREIPYGERMPRDLRARPIDDEDPYR
jgi:serine/threonine protein kinase